MKEAFYLSTLGLVLLAGVQPVTANEIIFSDNFSKNRVNPPTFSQADVQWVVDKGDFGTDGATVGGNYRPVSGELNFGTVPGTQIHINLTTAESGQMTSMEFSLRESNGVKQGNFLFTIRLESSTMPGAFYDIKMSPNPKYFVKSGVALYACPKDGKRRVMPGNIDASIRKERPAEMVRIQFDDIGGILLTVSGKELLNSPNSLNMLTIDRISFINETGILSYFIDNVLVEGMTLNATTLNQVGQ